MLLFLKFCATPIHPKLALQMIPIPFIQSYFQRSAPTAPHDTPVDPNPIYSKVSYFQRSAPAAPHATLTHPKSEL